MRPVPPDLQAHLEGSVVTVCRCWRLTRADGLVEGFTDHDEPVEFDGIVHSAMSGLASSGDVTRTGLGVGGLEISGALSSAGLEPDDLVAGRYDFATVSLWLVNWQDVHERVLMRTGTLGEVTRQDGAFRAEVRGPAQALESVRGRVFTQTCDADLGDARCRVDLAALARPATIVAISDTRIRVSGIDDRPAGYFADGALTVTSGAETGTRAPVALHAMRGTEAVLQLRATLLDLAVGDTVAVTPGCDKRFATCIAKFSNAVNFQGFPHLPGNDRAFSYAGGAS